MKIWDVLWPRFLSIAQCTEVHFASFHSGGFTTIAVINRPERKLAKRPSVQWCVDRVLWLVKIKIAAFQARLKEHWTQISLFKFIKAKCDATELSLDEIFSNASLWIRLVAYCMRWLDCTVPSSNNPIMFFAYLGLYLMENLYSIHLLKGKANT